MIMTNSVKMKSRIVIFGSSYGYNDNLMYYEGVFRSIARRVESFVVPVSKGYPVIKYPEINLMPILDFKKFKLKRVIGGVDYGVYFLFPSIGSFLALNGMNYDVALVVEFTPIAIAGILMSWIKGRKIIVLIEGHPKYRAGKISGIPLIFKKFFSKFADLFMVNNEEGADFLKSFLKIKKERIRVSPYLTSSPPINFENSCAIDYKHGKLNVLFLNNLSLRKGINNFLEIARILSNFKVSNIVFHVVGGGEHYSDFRSVVENDAELSHYFVFYGAVDYDQTRCFYTQSDIFFSPTLADYRALGAFEAISCECPVLLSKNDGAAAEIFSIGKPGLIFDPSDSKLIVEKLIMIANNPDVLYEYKKEAVRLSENYSYEKVAQNLLTVVQEALHA